MLRDVTHAESPPLDPSAHHPFDTVEDYILRCTDEIWVDRGVGLIRSTYYADDVTVHGGFGTSHGIDPVVEGTLQSISSYPDEVGYGEDVVWEQRGPDGFVSSHRVYSTGTNTGWTTYGLPTGRHFEKRALAQCLVRDGRIVEEWVVRDECRLVIDLGYDPGALAEQLAKSRLWRPLDLGQLPKDPCVEGLSGPRPPAAVDDDCRMILDMVEQTWNERRFDRIPTYHHRDVVLHTSRGRTLQGTRQLSTESLGVLAAFPDARMNVLDVCVHDHPRHGRRITAVWLLEGSYSGHAHYGPTTDSAIQLLGASQYVVENGTIHREFRVYDELALRVQIEQHRLEMTEGDAQS